MTSATVGVMLVDDHAIVREGYRRLLESEAGIRVVEEHGTGAEAVRALELETVRVSIANLRTFPFVPEREAAGKLRLRGAYFAIADGVLHVMGDNGEFAPAA